MYSIKEMPFLINPSPKIHQLLIYCHHIFARNKIILLLKKEQQIYQRPSENENIKKLVFV